MRKIVCRKINNTLLENVELCYGMHFVYIHYSVMITLYEYEHFLRKSRGIMRTYYSALKVLSICWLWINSWALMKYFFFVLNLASLKFGAYFICLKLKFSRVYGVNHHCVFFCQYNLLSHGNKIYATMMIMRTTPQIQSLNMFSLNARRLKRSDIF